MKSPWSNSGGSARDHSQPPHVSTSPDCPAVVLTWYDAAAYCRWLDDQDHVPEEECCYPPIPEIKEGMRVRPGYLERTGHRLPTYAEWEYACRAGSRTARPFGNRDELVGEYAWYVENSARQIHPVGRLKPNAFGLFDMLGNALEWCHESVPHVDRNPTRDVEDPEPGRRRRRPLPPRRRLHSPSRRDSLRYRPRDRPQDPLGRHRLPGGAHDPSGSLTRASVPHITVLGFPFLAVDDDRDRPTQGRKARCRRNKSSRIFGSGGDPVPDHHAQQGIRRLRDLGILPGSLVAPQRNVPGRLHAGRAPGASGPIRGRVDSNYCEPVALDVPVMAADAD